MALKGVSSSASAAASASGSAKNSSGVAGLLGATPNAAAAATGAASASPGAPGTSPAEGAYNFLQMLTQSAQAGHTAAKSGTDTPQPSQEKSADDGSDAAADAVAIALAMLSQSVAPMTQQAPQHNAALAPNDTVGATAAASATAAGPSGPASASGDSAQNLISLLLPQSGSEDELLPHSDSTRSEAGTDGHAGDANATRSDNGPTVASSAATAHLSVGSHFSLQHMANSAANALELKSPVGSGAFADELGDKITWMAQQGIQSASLQLSPAHLGPVEVRISVQDGGASVWFGAAQADTRAALEQALPRLRAMFATTGLALADAGVSREPPKHQSRHAVQAISGVSGIATDEPPATAAMSVRLGLLDTYA